ncbi:MAG: hypothetical protein M1827_000438 [Pycnora praestabilis]|nr:MAG: hypothetical protein M1827_000438 [Pycnora praestabilis]
MLTGSSPPSAHFAQNASLILLSLFFLPLDTAILFLSYAVSLRPSPFGYGPLERIAAAGRSGPTMRRQARRSPHFQQRTIVVTGVGMTKGLKLARVFYEAGHRVIGADFEPNGVPVSGRFSVALAKFYSLSKPNAKDGATHYIKDILTVVIREKVDLWVSCSGVASAVEDGMVKEILEKRTQCKAIQFDVTTTATLHEKHSFIEKTTSLGLPAPETHSVTSRHAVHKVLHNTEVKQYIMKSVGVDDAARGDMTLLPRPTVSETYQHMAAIKISKDSPWVLQQYIKGEEYCTHALVVGGEVKAFVACPSLELLMHYEALPPKSALSMAMLEFTQEFARRCGIDFTGHLSFDFLVEEKATPKGVERSLYPIECNPRAHTAVVLFQGLSSDMSNAYLEATRPETNGIMVNGDLKGNQIVIPHQPAKYYWIGHDLVSLVLQPLLHLLTLSLSLEEFVKGCAMFLQHLLLWKDGTYEVWDPLPWWWLYHVYWPGQFVACILQGRKWSRINVSTTKMFGC